MAKVPNSKKIQPKAKATKNTVIAVSSFVALIALGIILYLTLGQAILATEWFNTSIFAVLAGVGGATVSLVAGSATIAKIQHTKHSLPNDYYKLATLNHEPEKNAKQINKLLKRIARKELIVSKEGIQTQQQYDGMVKKDADKTLGKQQNYINALESAKQFGNLSKGKLQKVDKLIALGKNTQNVAKNKNQQRFESTLNVAGMKRLDNQVVSITASGAKIAENMLNSKKEQDYMFNKKNKKKYGSKVSVKANKLQEVSWRTNADELTEEHEKAKLSEIAEIYNKGEVKEKDIFPITITRTYYKSANKHETTTKEIENKQDLDARIELLDDYIKNPSKYEPNKRRISTRRFYEKRDTKDSDITK